MADATVTRLDELIRKATNERKDAIENSDRKGRWYAEGKVDALKGVRIEHIVASTGVSEATAIVQTERESEA